MFWKLGLWLGVFENRMLRRIFGPKRDEVTRERRNLRNEEFYNLYYSQNIINIMKLRRMRWVGHPSTNGEEDCM
jgi:hypothetical protein